MQKIIYASITVMLAVSFLTACAREEFMDLKGFVNHFECGEYSKKAEDFYLYKSSDGYSYISLFGDENENVLLKLICSSDNKIDEVRIFIPKTDENGTERTLEAKDISLFTKVIISSLMSYTHCDFTQAENIIKEMNLYDKNSYKSQGELSKEKDSFYYTYFSSYLGSEFTVINTFLKQPDKSVKPESKPAYGDTTNIRQSADKAE